MKPLTFALTWFVFFGVTFAFELVDIFESDRGEQVRLRRGQVGELVEYPVSGLDAASDKFDRIYRKFLEDFELKNSKSLNYEASIKEHIKNLPNSGDFWLANMLVTTTAVIIDRTTGEQISRIADKENKDVVIKFHTPRELSPNEKVTLKLIPTEDSMEIRRNGNSLISYLMFVEEDGPPSKEKFIEKLKAGHEFLIPITFPGKEPANYLIKW